MTNGLYAVAVSQFGVTVLRCGWFRRQPEDPDEYDVVWCTPYRGEVTTKLTEVWLKGPKSAPNWTWSDPIESTVHRFHFVPLGKLDPEKWAKVCGAQPKGWE